MQKVQELPFAPAALQDLPVGINGPDMSDLPSQIDYALAFPKQGEKRVPFALTFREQTTTVRTLLDRFLKATSYSVPLAKDYFFILNNGIRLQPKWEIKDLLKLIGKERLDGVVFNVHSSKQKLGDQQYVNECCVIDYKNSYNYYLRVQFTLAGNNPQVVYVKCQPSSYGSKAIDEAKSQIKNEFGIKELQETEEVYFQDTKMNKLPFKSHQLLTNQKVYIGDTLKMKIKNTKKLVLKRVVPKKFNSWIVIYKEGEAQPKKLKYDDIYHLTFGELYKKELELKQSQKKKDAIYCLMIMDKIVKPLDKLSEVEIYFVNNEAAPIEVVGKVVNEKMIFYNVIPTLCQKFNEFTLDQLTIPQNQHEKRQLCRQLTEKRAQNSKIQYFKKPKHVEPILIYTSELRYKDETTNKPQRIYESLNKYLRSHPVLSLDQEALNKEWRLRYASSLLKHLPNAHPYDGKTWRGINYNPLIIKQDIGKIFTFKQFTSSSKAREKTNFFAEADETGICNIYCFQLKTGRSVIEYSQYEQGEILIQPHTQFILTNISEEKVKVQDKVKTYKIYHMNEQVTSKKLPGFKANFIVWIDDKTGQNRSIYEQIRKNMKQPQGMTVFHQITSTVELTSWLSKHKELFYQKTANLIFITNMTRKQGNNLNYEAGIDGLREIRKVSAQLPVFFFIGNLQATNQKLTNSKLPLKNVKVGNQTGEISKYLNQQLNKKK